jgi:hypothetical protein
LVKVLLNLLSQYEVGIDTLWYKEKPYRPPELRSKFNQSRFVALSPVDTLKLMGRTQLRKWWLGLAESPKGYVG